MTNTKLILAMVLTMAVSGCSLNKDSDIAHTGDAELELQQGSLKPSELKQGMTAYVASQRLNLRSAPEVSDNIVAVLDINDKVAIVDTKAVGDNLFVGVKVLESKSSVDSTNIYYTSANHLNAEPLSANSPSVAATKYYIVTNIATEKVRVYRTCEPNEGCVNKMIFEQDVVNGEDDNGTRTDVGSFRITSWDKFYESGPYPAWYRPGYPSVPSPGASMRSWFDKRYMPGGRGDMRGAFGWYTAKIGPNPRGQWIHGTAGWGADKKNFILFKETFTAAIVNLFSSIRSHGCTRIDNESIAYLRSLLPIGTPYVKIYAKEAYRDAGRSGYSQHKPQWSYILTTVGYGKTNNHQLADREAVLNSGTPQSQWIDSGTLEIDQYPDAVPYGRKGDLYRLGSGALQGVFLVDEGTVIGYQHPARIFVGGYADGRLPNVMYASGSYDKPAESSYSNGGGGNRPTNPGDPNWQSP